MAGRRKASAEASDHSDYRSARHRFLAGRSHYSRGLHRGISELRSNFSQCLLAVAGASIRSRILPARSEPHREIQPQRRGANLLSPAFQDVCRDCSYFQPVVWETFRGRKFFLDGTPHWKLQVVCMAQGGRTLSGGRFHPGRGRSGRNHTNSA